jgi:hypothetical protein
MFTGFQCTRAIDIHEIEAGSFTVVDAFGTSTLPFTASSHDELLSQAHSTANVVPLTHADGSLLLSESHPLDSQNVPWMIEEPFVARVPDSYRIWLCGSGNVASFDAARSFLPIAYSEAGWGHGSKKTFESIHESLLSGSWPGSRAVTKEMLFAYMHHVQLQRICDDLVALLSRAIASFQRVLGGLRRAVRAGTEALEQLGVSEVVHTGPLSYQIAADATLAVVSATSSLDIATKLVALINETRLPPTRFRGASGRQYHELGGLKTITLPSSVLSAIHSAYSSRRGIPEMIQFRHDLIHSTTAIELERTLYVGRETDVVNALPLYYAELPWRDVGPNGQPDRFLGRDYFTSQRRDFDAALHSWLADVIQAHADMSRVLLAFFADERRSPRHQLPGI